nr:hypothetical protein [Alphaproteobacteria bacterium]
MASSVAVKATSGETVEAASGGAVKATSDGTATVASALPRQSPFGFGLHLFMAGLGSGLIK